MTGWHQTHIRDLATQGAASGSRADLVSRGSCATGDLEQATATLSDASCPCSGIEAIRSQRWRTSRDNPLPSAPSTRQTGRSSIGRSCTTVSPPASSPTTQTPAAFIDSIAAGSPPTSAIGRYSTAPAAALVTVGVTWAARWRGQDDPGHPCALGDAQQRTQVAGVGHAVDGHQERQPAPSLGDQVVER